MASQAATASGIPVLSNIASTKSATIKWNDTDTQAIIDWLSKKDREGFWHNLDKWNKKNKQYAAEKMLYATELISKSDYNGQSYN